MVGHICTHSPVKHGGVAGVHVDANAVARFGITGTADSLQALQRTAIPIGELLEGYSRKNNNVGKIQNKLTATKSTFFSADLGMVNGSHRSCKRELRVTIYLINISFKATYRCRYVICGGTLRTLAFCRKLQDHSCVSCMDHMKLCREAS